MRFKHWFENSTLDQLFALKDSKIIKRDPPQTEDYILKLYRGFDLDWNELKKSGNNFILSPKQSEQGLIWFTHQFITYYNPIEYAANHGEYFLTYHLKCKKYSQTVHWSDGTTSTTVPEEFKNKSKPTENCRFYSSFELPEGWVFSYKVEKFIGCSHEILISKDMVQKSEDVLNEV